MKLPCHVSFVAIPLPILLSISVAWAAEPSDVAPPNSDQVPVPTEVVEAPPSAPPAADEVPNGPATAPTSPASPVMPSNRAAPNSVEASPYGVSSSEPPPSAAEAPPPRSNVPATLFDSTADYAIGGFGGFGVMYTRLAGGDRPLVCGEGAVIIDHTLTLGGGGCGVAALMDAQNYGAAPHNINDRMSFGYGGAIARYHFFSRSAFNFAVGMLVGAGGVEIATWSGNNSRSDFDNYNSKTQDPVFVMEPQIGGYANITRWLRFGASGGYRFISGVDIKGLSSKDLMGPTLGGQLQAGWF